MRFLLTAGLFSLLNFTLCGQSAYPIKSGGRWGLMDAGGRVVLPPSYDLIGNPDEFGYLVAQRGTQLGLLAPSGRTVLPVRYEDIQVLDEGIIAVLQGGQWRVINEKEQTVLPEGYLQLRPLGDGFLAYRRAGGWGVVDHRGQTVVPPRFTDVRRRDQRFFETGSDGRKGLIDRQGREWLSPIAEEIVLDTTGILLYRTANRWGGIGQNGRPLFAAEFLSYRHLGTDQLVLTGESGRTAILPADAQSVFYLPPYAEAVPFSRNYLAYRSNGKIGLLNHRGNRILNPDYDEIQPFSLALFRVKQNGQWGLSAAADQVILTAEYDYVSPLSGSVASVRSNGRVGLLNFRGEILLAPEYDQLEIDLPVVRAFRGGGNGAELITYSVDQNGELSEGGASRRHFKVRVAGAETEDRETEFAELSNRLLKGFEWFYDASDRRWGLRSRRDGELVIAPTFSEVEVLPDLGFTLVGLQKSTELELERTSFRANRVFGLLLNEEGILITELNLIDLRVEDWRRGSAVARCLLDNGKFGLIDRNGRIVRRDLAYVGEFRDGLAPISVQGKLSGSLEKGEVGIMPLASFFRDLRSGVFLTDYTSYDQEFARAAQLVCRNCAWGFVDETGTLAIRPRFSSVSGFRDRRAIVTINGNSGLIDERGNFLISPAYRGIERVAADARNATFRLVRPLRRDGLVDTFGRFVIRPEFEEVGKINEGLIPAKSEGRWGFLAENGRPVIPFRYEAVKAFSGGLAPVKRNGYWTFIDTEGEERGDAEYLDLGPFREGLAWAVSGEKSGYIDLAGQFVIPPAFDRAFDFDGQVARVVMDGKYGLIDPSGAWVLRPKYADIAPFQANGTAIARLSGTQNRYTIIDRQGKSLTGLAAYRQIDAFKEGLARVKSQSGYGYIDGSGREVIPANWGQAESFSGGRAVVRQNGRCGFIDTKGDLIIPIRYSRCLDFEDDRAVVYHSIHSAGLIDKNGHELISPSLDRLLHFREGRGLVRDQRQGFYYITDQAALYDGYYDEARPFYHGVAAIRQEDRWGLINRKGLPLIRPRFSKIESFEEGMARVTVDEVYGLVNAAGREILPVQYAYVELIGPGLFRVEKGNEMGYLSTRGEWVWPLAE